MDQDNVQDNVLNKMIKIILLQKDSKIVEHDNKPRPKSSMESFKQVFVPSLPIQPPPRRSYSQVSLETKQTLQALQNCLKVEVQQFYRMVESILMQLSLDSLSKDAYLYKLYLSDKLGWDLGLSNDALLEWKTSEDAWIYHQLEQTRHIPYFSMDDQEYQSQFYLLTLYSAQGLKAKELNQTSNAYPFVTFCGTSWIGPIFEGSVNPSFNWSIAMYSMLFS